MSDETTPDPPAPPSDPKLDPKLFLPPQGSLEEQIARQIDFMTQGVMECIVRSSGLFEPPPPEAEAQPRNDYGHYNWKKQGASPPAGPGPRSIELRDAAHLSNAAARLIAAHAKLRGEFHFTYSHSHVEQATVAPGSPCALPPKAAALEMREEAARSKEEEEEDEYIWEDYVPGTPTPPGPRRARKEDFGF